MVKFIAEPEPPHPSGVRTGRGLSNPTSPGEAPVPGLFLKARLKPSRLNQQAAQAYRR